LLLKKAGINGTQFDHQMDTDCWADLKDKLAEIFKKKTRDQWCQMMEGTDVCFAPVLSMEEAKNHPHNQARNTFIDINGITQPAPGPRFSRTQPAVPAPPPKIGEHNEAALADWGIATNVIRKLKAKQII
ncbi:MAG: CoA transferase, partial [Deltaproteobacteria bacterium]|nr:CoA transferase [Deltaproteobacteria bacterium]